nr:protein TIME FOR COFFEE isoform X2 [Ipomoea batatas]
MERIRGGRRTSAENFNLISKRRQRISSVRNAPGEDKQMDERVRLRDREQICKKEGDRLYGKRKRTSCTGSDGSSENNGEEEEYEEEERKVHRSPNPPPKQTLPSSSMSIRHRRTVAPARVAAKSSPANEIVGFHIPKKARSVKRTYEYCNSGTAQFGDERNHRRLSPLSTSRCVDGGAKVGSCLFMVFQKLLGPKTRHQMILPNSSSLIQDELEVAEALFDLMKQSRSPSQSQSLSPSQGSMKRSDYSSEKICSSSSIPSQTSDSPQEEGSNKKDAVSEQNGSIAEMNTQEQLISMEAERIVGDSQEPKDEETSMKGNDSIDLTKELLAGGRAETEELVSAKVEESQSCDKIGVDNLSDSAKVDTTFMVVDTNQKTKSKIVLMEGVVMQEDEQKVVGTERGEQKLDKIFLKEELCKDHQVQKEQNQCRNAIHKENKIDQPSLFALPVAMVGRPGVFPYPGYTPALQTVLPIDPSRSTRSSNAVKSPPFLLSPTRPKKCVTHQYIALNIKHHQHLVKNSKWCAPAGPDKSGAKLQNHSPMASSHPLLLGDARRGQRLNTIPILGGKDQTSGITNIGDSSKDKQLMLQHPLLLLSGSNSLHGPDLMFPLGQHRTMVGSSVNQSGPPKPAKAMGKTSLQCNSAVRGETAFNSSSMPADATTISFKGINLHANKAPPQMMAMVQNNGYPFSMISNNVEMLSPFLSSAIPNVPGPGYSPTFQTFKAHQQPVSHNASTSTGSLSHKQPPSHQQKDPHSSRNSYLMSATTHSQQSPSHPPKKMGADISTQTSALISKHTFHRQKPYNGQHLSNPVQPINFALMPPGILGTGGKIISQQQQQQGLKVGEEFIPQTFAGSVGSTTSATPALNLSSVAQNPSILHALPDMSQLSVFICHPNGTA